MDRATTRFIAVTVTVVWAASTLAAIVLRNTYQPPVELHAIMGLVVGSLGGRIAVTRIRENGNGKANGSD